MSSREPHTKIRTLVVGALSGVAGLLCLFGALSGGEVDPPRIFYTSERAVILQLGRLKNEQLVLVERSDGDEKYRPVYEFLLTREGLNTRFRAEAVAALAKLNRTDAVEEILAGLQRLGRDGGPGAVLHDLAAMLLGQDVEALSARRLRLEAFATGELSSRPARSVAFAALAACTPPDEVWHIASFRENRLIEFLDSLPRVKPARRRAPFFEKLVPLLERDDARALRCAAILALPCVTDRSHECFTTLARFIREDIEPEVAVRAIQRLPRDSWPREDVGRLADAVLAHAARVPPDERTTEAFLDAVQLGHKLSLAMPPEEGRRLRDRLGELGLRGTPWKLEDLVPDLPKVGPERSEAGRKVFTNAGCVQCHRAGGEGNTGFGPSLDGTFQRWKGNRSVLLREILQPSHTIDERYRNYVFVLNTGRIVSGLITSDGPTTITVQSGPAVALAQDVERTAILQRKPQAVSIMPVGLLDPLPRENILDLLSFLEFAALSTRGR